ncbi:hypothetical protein TYRP_002193 [Tyrophagus putrescentiae]|nr:hypothetical protein TYRP_002193 [Tyrophagus putrescentiae]
MTHAVAGPGRLAALRVAEGDQENVGRGDAQFGRQQHVGLLVARLNGQVVVVEERREVALVGLREQPRLAVQFVQHRGENQLGDGLPLDQIEGGHVGPGDGHFELVLDDALEDDPVEELLQRRRPVPQVDVVVLGGALPGDVKEDGVLDGLRRLRRAEHLGRLVVPALVLHGGVAQLFNQLHHLRVFPVAAYELLQVGARVAKHLHQEVVLRLDHVEEALTF